MNPLLIVMMLIGFHAGMLCKLAYDDINAVLNPQRVFHTCYTIVLPTWAPATRIILGGFEWVGIGMRKVYYDGYHYVFYLGFYYLEIEI